MYEDKKDNKRKIDLIIEAHRPCVGSDMHFLLGYIRNLENEVTFQTSQRKSAVCAEMEMKEELSLAKDSIIELRMLLNKEDLSEDDVAISWSYGEHLGIKNSILVNTRLRISCWLVFTLRENGNTQLEAICSTARLAAQDRRGILHRAKEGFLDKNKVVRCWVETSLINHLLGSTMYTEL